MTFSTYSFTELIAPWQMNGSYITMEQYSRASQHHLIRNPHNVPQIQPLHVIIHHRDILPYIPHIPEYSLYPNNPRRINSPLLFTNSPGNSSLSLDEINIKRNCRRRTAKRARRTRLERITASRRPGETHPTRVNGTLVCRAKDYGHGVSFQLILI